MNTLRLLATAAAALAMALLALVGETLFALGFTALGTLRALAALVALRPGRAAAHLRLPLDAFARASRAPCDYGAALQQEWRRAWNGAEERSPTPPAGQVEPTRGMRLLVLSARLPRMNTDGSWGQLLRLREQGRRHDVTVFALLDDPADDALAEPLRETCREVITLPRPRRCWPGNLHHGSPHRLARDYGAAELRDAILQVVARDTWDAIQVEYAEMAHAAGDALRDQPTLYVVHEPMSVFYQREFERAAGPARLPRRWRWWQAVGYELAALRRYRHVVTVSDVDQATLQRYNPALPITTIPNAIDADRLGPMPEVDETPTVTFVAFFGHRPNTDAALWLGREIFPLVRAEVPDARLRLVGRDPTPAIRALAAEPGIEVAGFVEDLRRCMAESAVMTIPVRLGGGLRGKLLEAWAAGRAVVTTSVGAEGFPVEPEQNAMVADDTEAFAAALIRCLTDAEHRCRLGAAGREVVRRRYTLEGIGDLFDAALRDTVDHDTAEGRP